MGERKRLGDQGEAAASAAMERRGYRILARQYRCRWGEIDLIAWDPAGVLCFVEVKTRSPGAMAQGREAVTPAKRRRVRLAASDYLAGRGLDDCPCRFDVAEVCALEGGWHVSYIISAFE